LTNSGKRLPTRARLDIKITKSSRKLKFAQKMSIRTKGSKTNPPLEDCIKKTLLKSSPKKEKARNLTEDSSAKINRSKTTTFPTIQKV
jgi:hypothetical protein